MSTAYDELLREVCVGLGFCGSVIDDRPLHVDQFLPASGLVSADDFATAVFKAEGWDPHGAEAQRHRPKICEVFVRHLGRRAAEIHRMREE